MPNQQNAFSCVTIAMLLGGVAGCGSNTKHVPVSGTVSYRNAPITSGTLTFFPSEGRPVTAVIDRNGVYSCELPPGRHRVTVTVGVDVPAGWQEGDPLPRPKLFLPPQYSSRKKTRLSVDVAAGQQGPVDFSLE